MDEKAVHVLCADDDSSNRKLLSAILRKAGYLVNCVDNGKKALDAIVAAPATFDIVITDHDMPVMSGMTLISKLGGLPFKGAIILNSATIAACDLAAYEHKFRVALFEKPINPSASSKIDPEPPGSWLKPLWSGVLSGNLFRATRRRIGEGRQRKGNRGSNSRGTFYEKLASIGMDKVEA